jgi:NAD(P)-dependent dehydrogenase (short-subunit alcohol dehydrogenase family)
MQKLKGKVALVTGGSAGIGLAIAKRFADEGAHVVILGRRRDALDAAAAEIGRDVTAVQGDAASLADLDRLFTTVKQTKGLLDVVVANAGLVEHATIETATPDHFDRTFALNARGVFFTVQKALPLMTRGGSIVLVSSGAHAKGIPTLGAYAATKAALRSFARTWAVELKDRRIRVNTLSPGAIETPLFVAQFASNEEEATSRKMFDAMTPLGRIGRPEDIAATVAFLTSPDAAWITGQVIDASGGLRF